jgi:DNA (cytosine-5)-methyltransferase 1
MNTIYAADLFCGAGGTSTGLMMAAQELGRPVNLLALNHWSTAIDTHKANHPGSRQMCETLDAVDPRKAVPGGKLNLLVASPECTHHSNARGGKPMSDQSRATAWHIPRWADALNIDNILIENVREFMDWGPIDAEGRPIKEKKGRLFLQLLETLDCLGYTVAHRVLNSAHYGDATSRQRLFVQARKNGAITWPTPSHMAPRDIDAYPGAAPWRTAREIIDWKLPGVSIYDRKRPLAPKTLQRIYAGLQKFCGLPFIVPNFGERDGQSPRTHAVDSPLPTVTGHGAGALVQPYLVILQNNRDGYSVDKPMPTILTSPGHFGLAEPFIIPTTHSGGEGRCHSMGLPLPTITGAHRGEFALIDPYLIKFYEGSDAASVDRPLPAITANYEHFGLAQPYLCEFHGGEGGDKRTRSLDEPLPTQDCSNRFGLAQPFIVKFYGTGEGGQSVDTPLGTITSRDRFGLVEPHLLTSDMTPIGRLDIRFRMLQPHELAAAMSFPPDYEFTGNREDRVRQVGNAVPVRTAKALCLSMLRN